MKKKVIICILLVVLVVGGGFLFFFLREEEKKRVALQKQEKEEKVLQEKIENAFSSYAFVTKESKLYKKDGKKYIEAGSVYQGMQLALEKEKITSKTKYFKIKDTDFYVPYDVLEKKDQLEIDTRYQRYIPQEEVTIKEESVLSLSEQPMLSLKEKIKGTVYKKQNGKTYLAYQNQLFSVKDEDVLDRRQLDLANAAKEVPVLVYHFIYLNGESCGESICFHEDQISAHFSYLQEAQAFTINTTEMKEFIKGEIELPKKSVLVTIDDGARAEKFIPFLEKYQVNATLFLITSWYDKEPFLSPYMEIASHGHDLHNPGVCPGGQGGGIKCLKENVLQNDFKLSREKLDGTTAFCYPFYEYNDYAVEQLKKGGFEIAFRGGMTKAKKGTDLFRVPRISLNSTTTREEVKQIVEG